MDFGLTGKVVIVTGATANIGRAIALDFAAEGARVITVGRDEEAAARLIDVASARGAAAGAVVFVKADMLEPASAAHILAQAERVGPVEVLVNNVGGAAGRYPVRLQSRRKWPPRCFGWPQRGPRLSRVRSYRSMAAHCFNSRRTTR